MFVFVWVPGGVSVLLGDYYIPVFMCGWAWVFGDLCMGVHVSMGICMCSMLALGERYGGRCGCTWKV